MNTNTMCGNRTALTPRSFVLGAYAATNSYDANASLGPLPLSPSAAAVLADSRNIDGIKAKIAELTLYEKNVRAYYDARVSRTSGGKRDRLRAERKDLTYAALDSLSILRSGLATAERAYTAAVISRQDDFNPGTGAALTPSEKAIAANQAQAQGSTASKLIIPIGVALAALFFLKGH